MAETLINPRTGRPYTEEQIRMLREMAREQAIEDNKKRIAGFDIDSPTSVPKANPEFDRGMARSLKAEENTRLREQRQRMLDSVLPTKKGLGELGERYLTHPATKRLDEWSAAPAKMDNLAADRATGRLREEKFRKPRSLGGAGWDEESQKSSIPLPRKFVEEGPTHAALESFALVPDAMKVTIGGGMGALYDIVGDDAMAQALYSQAEADAEMVRARLKGFGGVEKVGDRKRAMDKARGSVAKSREKGVAALSDVEKALYETAEIVGPLYAELALPLSLGHARAPGMIDLNKNLAALVKQVGGVQKMTPQMLKTAKGMVEKSAREAAVALSQGEGTGARTARMLTGTQKGSLPGTAEFQQGSIPDRIVGAGKRKALDAVAQNKLVQKIAPTKAAQMESSAFDSLVKLSLIHI